jgi:hypothetical protein
MLKCHREKTSPRDITHLPKMGKPYAELRDAKTRKQVMKLIGPLTLVAVLQASPGLAQQPSNEHHGPVVIHNPPVHLQQNEPKLPVVRYAPPQAPPELPSADRIAIPGLRNVPSVSSLPGMRHRPIVRRVVVNGITFGIPAIVVVGAPYVIDLPGFGWVYVSEDEYPTLFDMLTSDNPAQVEAAYTRLQELTSVHQ